MIGSNPTVGCLIVLEKASYSGLDKVILSLQSLIPIREWQCSETGPSSAQAALGGGIHPMIVMAQEQEDTVCVQLEFDEEEVVRLGRVTGLSLEQLFMPYAQAAKTLPGVLAVGIGFELSLPADLREPSLRAAGVATLFARDEDHKTWSRRETLPMVGHSL